MEIARKNPDRHVVFFAVGFETTAPANAMAAYRAKREGLANFSMLVSHVLVPPAIEAILSSSTNRVQAFLAAGHVCTVMGWEEYLPLAEKYRVPIVVTGFEPLDILEGVYMAVRQLESGRAEVENQYARAVKREGNRPAQEIMHEVFQRHSPALARHRRHSAKRARARSGLCRLRRRDAISASSCRTTEAAGECISGAILRGEKKPPDCPAFGTRCTPERPLGVTMVSSEGACAAYYRYRGKAAASASS